MNNKELIEFDREIWALLNTRTGKLFAPLNISRNWFRGFYDSEKSANAGAKMLNKRIAELDDDSSDFYGFDVKSVKGVYVPVKLETAKIDNNVEIKTMSLLEQKLTELGYSYVKYMKRYKKEYLFGVYILIELDDNKMKVINSEVTFDKSWRTRRNILDIGAQAFNVMQKDLEEIRKYENS